MRTSITHLAVKDWSDTDLGRMWFPFCAQCSSL